MTLFSDSFERVVSSLTKTIKRLERLIDVHTIKVAALNERQLLIQKEKEASAEVKERAVRVKEKLDALLA